MAKQGSDQLTLAKAARIVFRTGNPSEYQIAFLEKAIAKGVLVASRRAGSNGACLVSTEALSDFLASKACVTARKQSSRHHRGQEHGKSKPASTRGDRFLESKQPDLQDTVFDTSREVILAVLMRRSMRMRSSRFRAAVVGVQVIIVCLVAFLSFWALGPLWVSLPVEQKAVIAWLDQEYPDGYRVLEWGKVKELADPETVQMRLDFSYRRSTSRGWVKTDRIITLVNNQVRNVAMEEE